MEKIQLLYDHLIAEVPGLKNRPESMHVFAEEGETISYPGPGNKNFKLSYAAIVILENTVLSAAEMSFILLEFLDNHEPVRHGITPFTFYAELLSKREVDLTFTIPLTETIKAEEVEGAIRLFKSNERLPENCLLDKIDIEHQPDGPPDDL